jgi:hypothetical protein
MAQNNPTPGNNPALSKFDCDAKARFLQVAEWLGLDAPPISYEDGSILMDDALLLWCNAGGVCLDWVFCGSVKGMAIAYRRQYERERPFHDVLNGFDKVEQRLLLEAIQADRDGKLSLADAMLDFKAKVTEHRAST